MSEHVVTEYEGTRPVPGEPGHAGGASAKSAAQDFVEQARKTMPDAYLQEVVRPERKELVKLLVDSLDVPEAAPRQQRRLSELRGLGKEIWEGIDAQEYVDQLRSEWDERP
jgi:hypothetical protein